MSAQPISASDRKAREEAIARAAGWRAADLRWERMQEEANAAFAGGDHGTAFRLWRKARWLAFWRIRRSDPRYATSIANLAMAARLTGSEAKARRLYGRAIRLWQGVPEQILTITPSRRSRSSLFHLRMEARHWEAYQANHRKRLAGFVDEAELALAALAQGEPPPVRLYERWRGEKPPFYDPTRIVLAAALLIAAAPEDVSGSDRHPPRGDAGR